MEIVKKESLKADQRGKTSTSIVRGKGVTADVSRYVLDDGRVVYKTAVNSQDGWWMFGNGAKLPLSIVTGPHRVRKEASAAFKEVLASLSEIEG